MGACTRLLISSAFSELLSIQEVFDESMVAPLLFERQGCRVVSVVRNGGVTIFARYHCERDGASASEELSVCLVRMLHGSSGERAGHSRCISTWYIL